MRPRQRVRLRSYFLRISSIGWNNALYLYAGSSNSNPFVRAAISAASFFFASSVLEVAPDPQVMPVAVDVARAVQ
jgi:hypothetical protein